jgi:hypothetical protein
MTPISARVSISEIESTNFNADGPMITPVIKKPLTGGILNFDSIRIIRIAKNKIRIMSFSSAMIQYKLR